MEDDDRADRGELSQKDTGGGSCSPPRPSTDVVPEEDAVFVGGMLHDDVEVLSSIPASGADASSCRQARRRISRELSKMSGVGEGSLVVELDAHDTEQSGGGNAFEHPCASVDIDSVDDDDDDEVDVVDGGDIEFIPCSLTKSSSFMESVDVGSSECGDSDTGAGDSSPVCCPGEEFFGTVDKEMRGHFLRFLQCQLRLEALHCFGTESEDFALLEERRLWSVFVEFARLETPARCEKWVPFHTCLAVHERFIIEEIHHASEPMWDEHRRFVLMFLFRAHCRVEVFNEAQLPMFREESFWSDPRKCFAPGGPMERSMLKYRRKTGLPLQTGAFRIIPERVCHDDDENLVRNICRRSIALIDVAEQVFPLITAALSVLDSRPSKTDAQADGLDIYHQIRSVMRQGNHRVGGSTWVKMLMVTIDHGYPQLSLLRDRCEVGVGAEGGLRRLLPGCRAPLNQMLMGLTADINSSAREVHSSGCTTIPQFWALLDGVEDLGREKCRHLPLLSRRFVSCQDGLCAATVQVQLCEWRQFLDFCARLKREKGRRFLSLANKNMKAKPKTNGQTHGPSPRIVTFLNGVSSSSRARPIATRRMSFKACDDQLKQSAALAVVPKLAKGAAANSGAAADAADGEGRQLKRLRSSSSVRGANGQNGSCSRLNGEHASNAALLRKPRRCTSDASFGSAAESFPPDAAADLFEPHLPDETDNQATVPNGKAILSQSSMRGGGAKCAGSEVQAGNSPREAKRTIERAFLWLDGEMQKLSVEGRKTALAGLPPRIRKSFKEFKKVKRNKGDTRTWPGNLAGAIKEVQQAMSLRAVRGSKAQPKACTASGRGRGRRPVAVGAGRSGGVAAGAGRGKKRKADQQRRWMRDRAREDHARGSS
eukprot:TRINITY_DN11436_c0_g1_i1.p1 TRINITY_DN11436_c0_g1~~TRINITY_DN11436_c0_g1_i1.p1  ORF type:complete len:882 (-),score=157.69 TRINITY_DN11436_c0_g1_i1:297-2942(-)